MRALRPLLILVTALAACAPAHWHAGLEVATTHYGGSSHDTSSGGLNPSARPGDATMIGLDVGRAGRRWGARIRASYAKTGFSVRSKELDVTVQTTGRLLELAGLVSTRVGGIGPSGAIRAELGPALHLWDFDDEMRARASALGAVVYEWPVAARFSGALRIEGLLSPSWFNSGDVPPELERRNTWRYGASFGLRYRL